MYWRPGPALSLCGFRIDCSSASSHAPFRIRPTGRFLRRPACGHSAWCEYSRDATLSLSNSASIPWLSHSQLHVSREQLSGTTSGKMFPAAFLRQ
nr:hypothetical protein CFP56_19401 [Quercus suber]